jgi:hypothetical protein
MKKSFWDRLVDENENRDILNSTWSECVLSVIKNYPETLNDYSEDGLLPLHFMIINIKHTSSMKIIEALLMSGSDINKPIINPKYENENTFNLVSQLQKQEKNDGTLIDKIRLQCFEKIKTLLEKQNLENAITNVDVDIDKNYKKTIKL